MKKLPESKNIEKTRKVFIIELLNKKIQLDEYLMFFDISGFNSSNLKKKNLGEKR